MELDSHDEMVREADRQRWSASVRLAAAFSVVAGLFAILLAGRVPEVTIILSVIAVGTMVSWLHLEGSTPRPATVRHPRRHHHPR